jgi:hypothetical protein
VQSAALEALGAMRYPSALAILQSISRGQNHFLRLTAQRSIENIELSQGSREDLTDPWTQLCRSPGSPLLRRRRPTCRPGWDTRRQDCTTRSAETLHGANTAWI